MCQLGANRIFAYVPGLGIFFTGTGFATKYINDDKSH